MLRVLEAEYEIAVSPERLFAYAYGIFAQPAYVQQYWDELEMPAPRLPITKDGILFQQVADHGERLLYLHTYCQRYAHPGDGGRIPQGTARCTRAVAAEPLPEMFSYDAVEQSLVVGDGEFKPVAPEIWNYSISGLQVVKSWLDYRKRVRAGRSSSELDKIRPARWEFTEELLELLWLLEATIDLQPDGEALLTQVCESETFSYSELPTPTEDERKPPTVNSVSQPVLEGMEDA